MPPVREKPAVKTVASSKGGVAAEALCDDAVACDNSVHCPLGGLLILRASSSPIEFLNSSKNALQLPHSTTTAEFIILRLQPSCRAVAGVKLHCELYWSSVQILVRRRSLDPGHVASGQMQPTRNPSETQIVRDRTKPAVTLAFAHQPPPTRFFAPARSYPTSASFPDLHTRR